MEIGSWAVEHSDVGPGAARDLIIAAPPFDDVRAVIAEENVVTLEAGDLIVVGGTK
jgi:hypothetical protein